MARAADGRAKIPASHRLTSRRTYPRRTLRLSRAPDLSACPPSPTTTPRVTLPADVEFTTLIQNADAGDSAAAAKLFAAMYSELHTLAQRQLARNGAQLTLGATTLLHEAYLNIADRSAVRFPDRGQFMAYAARAMRGLIIDYARSQRAEKRGGGFHITGIGDTDPSSPEASASTSLDALGEALDTLATGAPALANLVDLHFFCGFSFTEIAEMRAVSERTVQRDWRKARLLLHNFLGASV